jgi:predicted membrane channel-forming protein YqfA (hemolysin III family)
MTTLSRIGVLASPAITLLTVFALMAVWATSPLGSTWIILLAWIIIVFQALLAVVYLKRSSSHSSATRVAWVFLASLACLFALSFLLHVAGSDKPLV